MCVQIVRNKDDDKEKKYVQYDSCKYIGSSAAYLVYIRLMNLKSVSHSPLCGCALLFQFGINLVT